MIVLSAKFIICCRAKSDILTNAIEYITPTIIVEIIATLPLIYCEDYFFVAVYASCTDDGVSDHMINK
jgi:hypothetical protein